MNTTEAARLALACLDLTSLNDADTAADIEALCRRASGPHGSVAAVCVWPRFVALARSRLPAAVKVAAVANFPDGSADTARAVRDTLAIVAAGLSAEVLSHGHTLATAQAASQRAVATLAAVVQKLEL